LVYVLDNGNSRIQKFDATGGFLKKWGFLCVVPGDCDGGFVGPYAIALDAHENIYVADTGNHRVQKFDSEGNFIRKWGTRGTGPAEFTEPKRICVDANGDVYVGDFHGVHRFDADGNFISQFGAPRVGNVLSLGVDPNGTIYAGNSSDVSLFSRDGAFLLAWDGSDVPPVEDCMHNVPTGTGSGLTLTDITFDSGQYIYATHAWGVFKFLWGPTPLKPTSWSAVKKTYRE
jgi:DNA-binding beta-propeller fold protein YncE